MDQSYGTPIFLETLTHSKESSEMAPVSIQGTITADTKEQLPTCLKILIYQHYLQDRRTIAKLVFLYTVVEGLVPAIDPDTFIKPNRTKRQIRSVKFTDCVAQNIIDRQVTNNTRSIVVPVSKTNQYRNSFFVDIIVSWNKLPQDTARAKIVEYFKEAPPICY